MAFCSLRSVVFSQLSPVSRCGVHHLSKNSECCFQSTLLSCCDLKVWTVGEMLVFWTSRPAPRATFPSQLSGGTDKGTTGFKFHYQCHALGLRRWGLWESRSLSQPPGGTGAATRDKSQLCCSLRKPENHSWKPRSLSPQPSHHREGPLDALETWLWPPKSPSRDMIPCAWCRHCARQLWFLSPRALTCISQTNSGKALACFHFGGGELGVRKSHPANTQGRVHTPRRPPRTRMVEYKVPVKSWGVKISDRDGTVPHILTPHQESKPKCKGRVGRTGRSDSGHSHPNTVPAVLSYKGPCR